MIYIINIRSVLHILANEVDLNQHFKMYIKKLNKI